MVEYQEEQLDAVFHALSDRTRRAIVARLVQGDAQVTELAEPFQISLAAVSKHLKVLEEAKIVEKTKIGRSYRCRATLAPVTHAAKHLEELGTFWRAQLDSLEQFLTKNNQLQEKRYEPKRKR